MHALVIDGVYAEDENGSPQFQVLLAPDNAEIERLAASVAERIRRFLQRQGLGPETNPEESDPLSREQPSQLWTVAGSRYRMRMSAPRSCLHS